MNRFRNSFGVLFTTVFFALLTFSATAVAQEDDDADVEEEAEVEEEEEMVDPADAQPADANDDDGMRVGVGPMLGYQVDIDTDFFDAEDGLVAGVDSRFGFDINDNIDFVANPAVKLRPTVLGDAFALNFDVNALAEFDFDAPVRPYVGPGANINLQLDPESDVSFGVNGVAGTIIDLDTSIEPFVQYNFTYSFEDEADESMFLLGGVNFTL